MTPETGAILLPEGVDIRRAKEFATGRGVKVSKAGAHHVVHLPDVGDVDDLIIECEMK